MAVDKGGEYDYKYQRQVSQKVVERARKMILIAE